MLFLHHSNKAPEAPHSKQMNSHMVGMAENSIYKKEPKAWSVSRGDSFKTDSTGKPWKYKE